MAKSKKNRATFIKSAIAFAKEHGFDGIDLDWEFPNFEGNNPEERDDFTKVVVELKKAASKEKMLVTAAVRASNVTQHIDIEAVHPHLDLIFLMSYDFHGGSFSKALNVNAPVLDCSQENYDIQSALDKYLEKGVDPKKLIFGLGSYGRTFNTQGDSSLYAPADTPAEPGECSAEKGVLGYYEIKRKDMGTVVEDDTLLAAYATYDGGASWVGFDTPGTIQKKVCYAGFKGLGGMFFWDGEMDDDEELIESAKEVLDTPDICNDFEAPSC